MTKIQITLTDEQKKHLEKLGIKNISRHIRELLRQAHPNLPPDPQWGGKRKKD